MRRVRVVLGLAVAVCAFGVLVAPAVAKKEVGNKTKEPVIFGKFTASIPGGTISPTAKAVATGHGEVTEINLANGGLVIRKCLKPVKSKGEVESESSETFFQNIKFSKCRAVKGFNKGGGIEEPPIATFTLGIEFHSNKSGVVGEGEGEIKIKEDSSVSIPVAHKGICTVVVPEQIVPAKAEKKPEAEYESVSYETEKEPAKIKKFPSGFQEKLNIEIEFSKVVTYVKPNEFCHPGGKLVEEKESPWFGYVESRNGKMALELEEITIKNGNLGFEPKI